LLRRAPPHTADVRTARAVSPVTCEVWTQLHTPEAPGTVPGAGQQSDARRLDPGFTTTSRPYRKGRAFPHLGIIMWTSWAGRLGTAIESDYETGRPIVRGAHTRRIGTGMADRDLRVDRDLRRRPHCSSRTRSHVSARTAANLY